MNTLFGSVSIVQSTTMNVGKNLLLPAICYVRDVTVLRQLVRHLGIGHLGRIVHDRLALRYGETRVRVNRYMVRFRITESADLHHAENMNGEEEFLERMMRACLPGDTFWDVGAYLGKFSVVVAIANQHKKVRVCAFEPFSRNAQMIRENARLNSIEQLVSVHQLALGNSCTLNTCEVDISDDPSTCRVRTGRPSVVTKVGSSTVTEVVRMVTGTDFALQANSQPNVVKIDVEGMEMDVLEGMSLLLQSGDIHDVFVEVHSRELEAKGLETAHVDAFLQSFGFQLVWVSKRRGEFLEHYQRCLAAR